MSYKNMNKGELKQAASDLNIILKGTESNPEIVKLLNDATDYATYKKLHLDTAEEVTDEPFLKPVLVKMERLNKTFEVYGFKFSQEHPFVAMSETEAQNIFDAYDGFRLATPKELETYYS